MLNRELGLQKGLVLKWKYGHLEGLELYININKYSIFRPAMAHWNRSVPWLNHACSSLP